MASWDTHATIVKYALDNGTVNDEIIEAVLAMTALCDFAGAEKEPPTLDQMLLLQVRRLFTTPGLPSITHHECSHFNGLLPHIIFFSSAGHHGPGPRIECCAPPHLHR